MEINIDKVDEVLDFIEIIKDTFEESELATKHAVSPIEYFTRGGCGQFYTILKSAFPEAIPYVTNGCGHVVTYIDGILYDVEGVYQKSNVLEDVVVTPELEKVVSNYAFSLKSRGFFFSAPGPTNICFLQAIDELEEAEMESLAKKLEECRDNGIMSFYEEFKSNEEEIYRMMKEEIEGHLFFEAC